MIVEFTFRAEQQAADEVLPLFRKSCAALVCTAGIKDEASLFK